MGGAYARNLLAAGFRVVGYDVANEPLEALRSSGGVPLQSARELAEHSDVVITALADPKALLSVCLGEHGLIHATRPGGVVIETSTLPLDVKETCRAALADAGGTLLDCPVSGTGAQAAAKDLLVHASGDQGAIERCRPVFDGFARQTLYVGPFGAGMKMKFIANHLVTIHNLASAEAMLLATRAGLDPELTYQAIIHGAGTSRIFEVRGPMMVSERYEPPTMKFDIYMKDVMLILDFARQVSSPTPLFAACIPFYMAALAQGRAKQDTAGLFAVLKELTGQGERRSLAEQTAVLRH
jgi:3-hydroxyisobutyrate dehydrogenase-like beta-hydroxyacid dehydrogenase